MDKNVEFNYLEAIQKICEKFNSYNWHDSKITSFKLERRKKQISEDICFELKLLVDSVPGNYKWEKAELILKNCKIIKMDLDLKGKYLCSDDILSATCCEKSEFKNNIQSEDDLTNYLHFQIIFIPPGGEINIIAKDFELKVIREEAGP